MNIFIIRTYFIITNLESDTRTYLPELHAKFVQQFPEIQVSRQRIGDQRRAIVNNKLLPPEKLSQIRAEVQAELIIEPRPLQIHSHESQNRMRWSNKLNESIIRGYFTVTELETNLTSYRPRLHEYVIAENPEIAHVSEQRISDQRRVIFNNKMVNGTRIQQIRKEVAQQLNRQCNDPRIINNNIRETPPNIPQDTSLNLSSPDSSNNQQTIEHPYQSSPTNIDHTIQNELDESTFVQLNEIESYFVSVLEKFQDIDPVMKPTIPKQKPSKKFTRIVNLINSFILPKYLNHDNDFYALHNIIYCAAYTASIYNGSKIYDSSPTHLHNKREPMWQKRLQSKIEDLRVKIALLTEYKNGNRSQTIQKQVDSIKNCYKTHSRHEQDNTDITHFLDTLKQKLNALASRLRRYKLTTLRKSQNKQFNSNEKSFYRLLNSSNSSGMNTHTSSTNSSDNEMIPNATELQEFWSSIWSKPVDHKEGPWIEEDKKRFTHIEEMSFEMINLELLQSVISKTHNWKAPGSDKIHNYWFKRFHSTHSFLLEHINKFIQSPHTMPSFVTIGTTYMLPKNLNDTRNPANYRPITCLQNIYKIITSCISNLIYNHTATNSILAEQQKGCRKFSQGCKEQLTIDAIVSKQAIRKKSNIYTMYIDYKKAFDSVPHSWLLYILQHYKINSTLVQFLRHTMQNWSTKLILHQIETDHIQIRRGIFQGDSLSPLWFCLALNPLSYLLNNSNSGYKIPHNNSYFRLTHLLYMDDIKLYASNLNEINKLANITEEFSNDIKMTFGIDKCGIQSIQKGKVVNNSYQLATGENIEPIDDTIGYKKLQSLIPAE
ncbi:uncharacterized protein LOC132902324 [Amyelois transitella]|uniref:uncharacterized protein LOC132902324 n=1 Tax=Amyelois transitella TaxID=680683 RepID=UPI0029902FD5|nr:uncharacterized protein LOC132902324 [Amyelois transitella]